MQCSEEQLIDALTGNPQPMHRELLSLQLQRLQLLDEQIYPKAEALHNGHTVRFVGQPSGLHGRRKLAAVEILDYIDYSYPFIEGPT